MTSIKSLFGYFSATPIMFTAVTNANENDCDEHTHQNVGEYVTFERFLINIGDTFDLKSGTFTSPVDGLFEFTFSGNAWDQWIGIQVYHNGDKKLQISTGMFILKEIFLKIFKFSP